MLNGPSWANGLATIQPDTQQHLKFSIYSNHLAQRWGRYDGLGQLLLSHAGLRQPTLNLRRGPRLKP
jgi:hypothetical protein